MTELKAVVVDEIEEEKIAEAKAKEGKGIDWDSICAYKTFKVVRIRDRNLGFCYWGIVGCVILYVVVFAFCIEGKHQQQEPGVGTVLTKVFGKAFSGDKVFDPSDLRFPVIEPSGAFLLTRRIAMEQKRGKCIDWDAPKRCPCDEGETCVVDAQTKKEFCEVSAWCPSIGETNVDNPPAGAAVDILEGLDAIMLKIMSGIAFPGIGNKFFVTGGSPGASNQFKNITVGELLALAEPPLKLDKKMLDTGALIGVSFFWNCEVSGDCEPNVVIKRLDSGQGFVQKRAMHARKGTEETRKAIYLNGLRILVDSSGIGRQDSFNMAIIQVGSAIALIRVAAIVADFLMLNSIQYSKTRKDAYYRCKVQETGDYSDLQDRINLIQATKSREETHTPIAKAVRDLKPKKDVGKENAGGRAVALGMGAGGRGGVGRAIIHGRL